MRMTFPDELKETLSSVGQAAVELTSLIEGYREFVSVFYCPTNQIFGFEGRFPNLAGNEIVYRLMRFRVKSSLIDLDQDCSSEDLIGLQNIYVATEKDALSILRVWQVLPESLRQPRETQVPV